MHLHFFVVVINTMLVSYVHESSVSNMGGSPGELSEELVTYEKRKKGWRRNCDVGEATDGLENEL